MTQRFSFWEDLTIRENLELHRRMYGMAERGAPWAGASDRLGLTHGGDQLAGTLSGGWNSGSHSRRACCTSRSCCCSTSQPRASIRRRGASSGRRFTSLPRSGHHGARHHALHGRGRALPPLAYILNGRLLAQGTVEEVVEGQPLVGWSVEGPDLSSLARDALASGGGAGRRVWRPPPCRRTGRGAACRGSRAVAG